MHCTFLAPELSATSSIERGWIIGQDTRVRILLIRHRFSLESGRVSSISTRSPTRLSFASSCALTFLALRTTRSYRGCRYTRSILTTRVFCMASLTTTASRVFRSPSAMLYALFAFFAGVFFAADFVVLVLVAAAARRRVDASFFGALGSVTVAIAACTVGTSTRAPCSRRIVSARATSRRAWLRRDGFLATPIESWKRRLKTSSDSSRTFCRISSSLRSRHFAGFIVCASERSHAADELRFDAHLLAGGTERLPGHLFRHAFHLVEDAARLHDGDPLFRVALALAHPSLGGLLRDRLVRKNPDPDLAASLEAPGEGHARGLDLAVRDPARLERLEAVFTEGQGRSTLGLAPHATALGLPVFDALGHQHGRSSKPPRAPWRAPRP